MLVDVFVLFLVGLFSLVLSVVIVYLSFLVVLSKDDAKLFVTGSFGDLHQWLIGWSIGSAWWSCLVAVVVLKGIDFCFGAGYEFCADGLFVLVNFLFWCAILLIYLLFLKGKVERYRS